MPNIVNLNSKNFQAELKADDDKIFIVDFWAEWCGPCKQLNVVLEKLAADETIKIGKVNVDEEQDLAGQYSIRALPTLIFFKKGVEKKRSFGYQDVSKLKEFISGV